MHPAIHKNASRDTVQGGLGPLMRYWRGMRGKSQLDVSLDTGISQRHISFIESGRSTPSRQTLLDIAQALDIPFRERNALLQSAGYAAIYSESPLEALETQGLRKALHRMLSQHAPFPALVMDRYWNVLLVNDCSTRFFNNFVDMPARTGPRNMLHLIFDPDGMRPFVVNWERTARSLSMVSAVGTPQTISAQELRIESMFPADDATEMRHIRMLGH
ncbi:helix-turn-helix domain-containing protein [Bordetella sp. FB-8]|uniref:helix-turn-helix domain-containing protein n=1 Tax=Bordetella sp. FB-8 TaxID=1159870 RepID=UPI0004754E4C|nr:helix-turn-helix transcriptional regulator [Bordetella sp. FB-8]